MRKYKTLGLLFVVLFSSKALAQLPDIEILSKTDAITVFNMSRDEWTENVSRAVAADVANAMGTPSSGLGMATVLPEGLLIVQPDFIDDSSRPAVIHVTVGYQPPNSYLFTDSMLDQVIEETTRQMQPEFDTIGRFERLAGGVAIYFSILESSR